MVCLYGAVSVMRDQCEERQKTINHKLYFLLLGYDSVNFAMRVLLFRTHKSQLFFYIQGCHHFHLVL